VIFNVTGGTDLTLQEVQQASEVVSNMVDPDCNIIFGMVTDPKMENEVKMTIIATGFPGAEASAEKEAAVTAALSDVLGDEEALDLPPFLRHHRSARRRSPREMAASD
jgi:cell division protein FtsZ